MENLKLLAGEEIKLEELGIPDDMTQEEDYNYFFHEYAILFKVCVPEGKKLIIIICKLFITYSPCSKLKAKTFIKFEMFSTYF